MAARLVREGAVTLDGRRARPSDPVPEGAVVEYTIPEPAPAAPVAESIPLAVLYDDGEVVVIDKPAGMVVHPAPGHPRGTLVHALLGLGGRWSTAGGEARPGIVHRLDAGTTGLMLAARTDAAHRSLSSQLADRSLSRSYLAIVLGRLDREAGIIEGAIGRDPRERKRMAVVETGRPARTRFAIVDRGRGHTLVGCELETGRTHQVRVHLAGIGHPIAGDRVYGGVVAGSRAGRPMLHAYRLRFRHPTSSQEMTFESPPPPDFAETWERLR